MSTVERLLVSSCAHVYCFCGEKTEYAMDYIHILHIIIWSMSCSNWKSSVSYSVFFSEESVGQGAAQCTNGVNEVIWFRT